MVVQIVNPAATLRYLNPRDIFGPLYSEAADKYPVSDRAARELDWQPAIGIENIIRDALGYRQGGFYANDSAANR